MSGKRKKTKYPGVRFREHATRIHAGQKDRYYIIFYRDQTRKQREEGIGWQSAGHTLDKANKIRAEIIENIKNSTGFQSLREKREANQKGIEVRRKKELTLKSYFKESYLPSAALTKKPYTVRCEECLFENWIESELGHLPFLKIQSFNVEKLKKKMLDDGKSPRSVEYCLAIVRQIWNHARNNDIIDGESPTKKVKIPKFDNNRLRFLTQEQAHALLERLKTQNRQVYNMALLSLHTGARAGEVFSLTWQAVDLKNSTLTVKDSKSQKTRYLYLTTETKKMISGLKKNNQTMSTYVFANRNGGKRRQINKCFYIAIKDLKFNEGVSDRRDKLTFHSLRHTFASWHVQNGTDLYTVKELLGHSTIQLTERYSHLRPDGLKQTAKNFDKIVKRKSGNKKVVSINK